ncbi:MAG: CBS domain-containing protein [Anaerolineales bacterium]|nr:CBS domain-containing protein [Anaerolineales bacterium]
MSLEMNLLSEKITHLDLSEYTLVESGASVRDTIEKLRSEKHNCAFVMKDNNLVGIFTDRDVMRGVVDRPEVWDHPIDELMTHDPQWISADQEVGEALKMMDNLHFRNVPVKDGKGRVVGNLTHFALIRYLGDLFPKEVYNLPPDPDQYGEERHGG